MYVCYVDESGVPEPGGGTSHFVLLGLAVPLDRWKSLDLALSTCKAKHVLANHEVHTAWMARHYPEQERIAGFEGMGPASRRAAVRVERAADLAKASTKGTKTVRGLAKNYKKSEPYIHLTHKERIAALEDLADAVGQWTDCALFADIQEKSATSNAWKSRPASEVISDHAFEQLVTRYHHFLVRQGGDALGLIVHDQNQAASTKLTARMRRFHAGGTAFAKIPQIVETPLFVDSRLTSMVQMADLCAYATRRFVELGESNLFDRIYPRFDRLGAKLVGARHYTGKNRCSCKICKDHRRRPPRTRGSVA